MVPILQGAQLWVRSINQRGGLNGHRVQLLVFDDRGDPARHQSQVQEAIERHKAVAFLANADVIAGEASLAYIASKRIPVIGSDGGGDWNYTHPMYFAQTTASGRYSFLAIAAMASKALVPQGKTKLATVFCQEAAACGAGDAIVAENAKRLGFDSVYRARVSVAQPDYTAQCLAARNAGADVFLVALDDNSVGRLTAACARQAYRPAYALVQAIHEPQKNNPNLDGALIMSNIFPFFQIGTPATDEFHRARELYGQSMALGVGPPMGWTAGKLLEKVGANLPEPPTTEALLHGLWSLTGETFGGLTRPLTFRKDKPTETATCWFTLTISEKTWRSPDGHKLQCDTPPGADGQQ